MKIGLPRFRMSRKLVLITLGVTVLLGGTGVTALYFGGKDLIMKDGASAVGGECTDIQTMVLKTPSNHLWLRRYIRMDNATGQERVRTALRIAGLLSKKNAVDLIHVSVLDTHGPDRRAFMRERAIGAEVMIALKPENLPEMKSPAMASYYEGPVSSEGRYYGDKVIVDMDEIRSMMTAMRTVEEKPDCLPSASEAEAMAKAAAEGEKEKKNEHGAKPEETQGEKPANAHGEEPATDQADKPSAENAHGEQPAKEKSFLDSMLGMVGLGGSDDPAPDESGAKDHGKEPATKSGEHDAKAAEQPPSESADASAQEPAKEQSFVDSMLGMVGLGGSEDVTPVSPEAVAEEPADAAPDKTAKEHSAAEEPVAVAPADAADGKQDNASHDPAPSEDTSKDSGAHDAAAKSH